MVRLAIRVDGVVHGVGFRPFVHRAATGRGLSGWVRNGADGVRLEVEGPDAAVDEFVRALRDEPPPAARVARMDVATLQACASTGFRILPSLLGASTRPVLPADLATCAECRAEIADPTARRFRYPFTNCTHCGPRYSIVDALPYDRARTAMRGFAACPECAAEYGDPADRRFHAEPIACPACGPRLTLLGPDGTLRVAEALAAACELVAAGKVLALMGLGGFQLLVDATSVDAVAELRRRKHRPEKPFAVLFPSLDAVCDACVVSPGEAATLASPEAPIVLLHRRPDREAAVVAGVAPGSSRLGALLPYTPLHHLLVEGLRRPLVCTSGNLAEEPMCIAPAEALVRLRGVADGFLVHDRPIVRPLDDSVVRVGSRGPSVLRRARGFAPLPLRWAEGGPCVLALGGHSKATVALALGDGIVVSQHLGDLDSPEGVALLGRTVDDLLGFFAARPAVVACDRHPDYASTRMAEHLAECFGAPLVRVQHHHAHVAAVVAEHAIAGPVLGLAWDGAGLGDDGTLWGGEALVVDGTSSRRVAHLRPFRLPGGERAMREPRRSALGLLRELPDVDPARALGDATSGDRVLAGMLARGVNAPWTTSVGRLFDAVAALAGIRSAPGFEGQAAMAVEFAADAVPDDVEPYPLPLGDGAPGIADWAPLVRSVVADRAGGIPCARIAARFHAGLATLATTIAHRAGLPRVVLAGGCFQNARLARLVRHDLEAAGFTVHEAQAHPPNDGGLSLGQALVAARRWKEDAAHVSRHSG